MDELKKNPTWSEGGVSGALSFLLLSVTTEWLEILPAIPEGQLLEYTSALGIVIAGIGRSIKWVYRKRTESKQSERLIQ